MFKRQVPLIDRAARICQALGLELYLGPVRACKAVEDGVGRVRRPIEARDADCGADPATRNTLRGRSARWSAAG